MLNYLIQYFNNVLTSIKIKLRLPSAPLIKNPPAMQEIPVESWVGKIHWRRDRLPTPAFLGFPCDSPGKEPAYNEGNLGSIPGLERSPGEGKGYQLHYSGLENSVAFIIYWVTRSRTWLSDFHFQYFMFSIFEAKWFKVILTIIWFHKTRFTGSGGFVIFSLS